MSADKTKSKDYDSLTPPGKGDTKSRDKKTLRPFGAKTDETQPTEIEKGFLRTNKIKEDEELSPKSPNKNRGIIAPEDSALNSEDQLNDQQRISQADRTANGLIHKSKEPSHSDIQKIDSREKRKTRDARILGADTWLVRNGHNLTYFGLYLFSFWVFFRPYELIPGLGFLSPVAFYIAFATLAIYLPTQLAVEGNLTVLSTEIKCVLALIILAIISIPIAKSPGLAWETFSDNFVKAVLMFIVMVNVLRTRRRLLALIWLSISIGLYMSVIAWNMYLRGEFSVEGTRVGLEFGGMFGNPNDMALHLVIMTPIVIVLGVAAKGWIMKTLYFVTAVFLVLGNMVTFSRGGFLGLLAVACVLAWKLGRKYRLNVTLATIAIGVLFVLFAPGDYGQRILSIFDSSLDAVGSSNQRTVLLKRSILVSVRNPWGIGIGNFPIVGVRNLGTHNAFTQVSSELGILGLVTYLILLVSPLRKLGAIERTIFASGNTSWFYYLSIGLQASLVGFMVSSFFAAIAYNWFIYYLVAYAVAFRRIYQVETGQHEENRSESLTEKVLGWRIKSA